MLTLLAGPIVRRVEPRLAAVWVATDTPCLVTLDIFRDSQTATALPQPQFHTSARTVRAGAKMHVALVVADLSDHAQPLLPEVIYSYNLAFVQDDGTAATLQTLGLLTTRTTPPVNLALGYGENLLPSFVLPPRQLKDLTILHGSCRRIGFDAPDAMTYVDDLLAESHNDAVHRPHQFFLTGDQIYADNLPTATQILVTNKANEYMGCTEQVPTYFPHDQTTSASTPLKCDLLNFPAGLRKNVIMHEARMSTSDGSNHLLSFGEFCMMHLLTWSNQLWETPVTQADAFKFDDTATTNPLWALHVHLLGDNPPAITTSPVADAGDATLKNLKVFSTDNVKKILKALASDPKLVKTYNQDLHATKIFVDGLPRVRRALANIATYMIFDDHEITDDWNFSKIWKDRVMSSELGSRILRNGLLAYALFQGWGNDPSQFTDVPDSHGNSTPSPQKQLLDLIPQMFPDASGTPPDAIAKKIDSLLGLTGDPPPPGTVLATWHYRVPGPRHLVLVLDVRTRRTSSGRTAAPQNLSDDAAKEQIPTDTDPMLVNLPAEIDVVLVVSSLVVLGPPVFDALFGPLSYKIFDIKDHRGQTALPATNPDAIESWPNDEPGFERLLNALAPLKRVVMLSGDVHYATSVVMSYWKDRTKPPARFAQLVCSAFKNDFFDKIAWADQVFVIFQKVLQLNDEAARIGWKNFVSDLLSLPAGKKPLPALDSRLKEAPILLPTLGWPDGTNEKKANPPDFAWRLHVVRDQRTDAQRPEAQRAAPLSFDPPAKDMTAMAPDFQVLAVRHAKQLDKMNFTRQMLFNTNLGAIRFERNGNVVTVIHQLYSSHPKALLPDKGEIYLEHRIDLDTPLEMAPFIGTPV
jgi:hypothetical protein